MASLPPMLVQVALVRKSFVARKCQVPGLLAPLNVTVESGV